MLAIPSVVQEVVPNLDKCTLSIGNNAVKGFANRLVDLVPSRSGKRPDSSAVLAHAFGCCAFWPTAIVTVA